MGRSLTRTLEIASNVAVLAVAGALLFTLYSRWQHDTPSGHAPNSEKELVGRRIDAENLPIATTTRVILALSQTCRFCEMEMPFYRTIADAIGANAELIAIFPENEPDPEMYMESRSVSTHAVRSVRFADLGIKATPTILLVDAGGMVLRAWIGALPEDKHKEVIAYAKGAK